MDTKSTLLVRNILIERRLKPKTLSTADNACFALKACAQHPHKSSVFMNIQLQSYVCKSKYKVLFSLNQLF